MIALTSLFFLILKNMTLLCLLQLMSRLMMTADLIIFLILMEVISLEKVKIRMLLLL